MKKITLVSITALLAAGAANAALLPEGGVVGTSTLNEKVGDEKTLTTEAKVIVPAINELNQAIQNIEAGINLDGVEFIKDKTQDIEASYLIGQEEIQYTSAKAVKEYVDTATTGLATTTDLTGKQDKATGMTSGNVALWTSDGTGKYQTGAQIGITNSMAGITTGNTSLTTGGAVSDAISALQIPQLDPTCMEAGVNYCVLSQDVNGWVWLRMY